MGTAAEATFVGRRDELVQVREALAAARGSVPQIVAIAAPAGMGKTAFLRRCLAEERDEIVLEVSGDESEVDFEYGVAAQLVAQAQAAVPDEMLEIRPVSALAVGADLLAILGALQDRAEVIVAVDDAHLMDRSTAGALLFALRRLQADRVIVLLVSRSDGLERFGPGWARLLDDPRRAMRIRLGGLTGPETSELADQLGYGVLTLAAGERLREHTGGHPLYVRALLRELPYDAVAFDHGPLPAPHSYSATVLARLARVSAAAQDLVAAAAVAGPRCELTFAGTVAGLTDPLAALEETLAAELLVLEPARKPEELAFPHPLVRAAMDDDLSPTRRRVLHLACADLTTGAAAWTTASPPATAPTTPWRANCWRQPRPTSTAAPRGWPPSGCWASRIAASAELRDAAVLRAVEPRIRRGRHARPGPAGPRHAVPGRGAQGLHPGHDGGLGGSSEDAELQLRQVMARPDFTSYRICSDR